MYPQIGHPISCYLSADPTSIQVALQLLNVGCRGILDLKPLLGRWMECTESWSENHWIVFLPMPPSQLRLGFQAVLNHFCNTRSTNIWKTLASGLVCASPGACGLEASPATGLALGYSFRPVLPFLDWSGKFRQKPAPWQVDSPSPGQVSCPSAGTCVCSFPVFHCYSPSHRGRNHSKTYPHPKAPSLPSSKPSGVLRHPLLPPTLKTLSLTSENPGRALHRGQLLQLQRL